MTKKQVIETLKGMNCEIAEVKIVFMTDFYSYIRSVLVYLVSEPSNEDQIIDDNHLWICSNITDFDKNITKINKEIKNGTFTQVAFIMVREFISDYYKEIDLFDETDEEKTIQWYKVKCSLFKEEFGVRLWKDLIDFMSHTIGFDYTITGQYTKPYTGVEGYYENGQIIKL